MELKNYLQKELGTSTADRYERDIKNFLLHLQKPQEASYQNIIEVLGHLRTKYSNPHTINRILSSIKKYYHYLQHIGVRKDHPCKNIKLRDVKKKDIQLQDLFSTQELELLLESHPKRAYNRTTFIIRDKLILSLLIYQGLVRTEISLIEINDINLEEATITVRGDEKTHQRTLPLKAKQIHLLYEYLYKERQHIKSNKLFISQYHKPIQSDAICRIVLHYQYLYPEKKLSCQTIRMSVTRNLLKEGKDIRLVQAYMGHKTPGTTEKYKQSHTEELKAAIQKYHPLGDISSA